MTLRAIWILSHQLAKRSHSNHIFLDSHNFCIKEKSLYSEFYSLKKSGKKPVRYCISVPLPVLAILARASVFIPDAPVNQKDGHVNDVEVRQNVLKATSQTVCQGAHQVSSIVEVACHSPESRRQQLTVVFGPISQHIGTFNVCGLLPPDFTVAIRTTKEVFLMIGHPKYIVAHQTQQQNPNCITCGKLNRVINQV